MGKANTAVNQWLKDHVRFASLYNGIVFGATSDKAGRIRGSGSGNRYIDHG